MSESDLQISIKVVDNATPVLYEAITRLVEGDLISLGFRDVSYPQMESQSRMFQLNSANTNLLVNLSNPKDCRITDGRPTRNHCYWSGEVGLITKKTVKLYIGNLNFQYYATHFE